MRADWRFWNQEIKKLQLKKLLDCARRDTKLIMGLFDFLFGNKTKKIQDFKSRGAIIIDVRTKSEYESGHIPGSKNIPLQELSSKVNEIKTWKKPIITCCASGVRSASAAGILKSNGVEAMNGGGWFSLSQKF